MSKRKLFILIIGLLISDLGSSQEKVLYKEIDTAKLYLDVYYPSQRDTTKTYPAMVFFFGGGWKGGSIAQFEPHATYFSKRGLVCFLVDYRTFKKYSTTPFDALKDAKTAMRFIRERANLFNIDPLKILAAGGSAGGHLAAACALIPEYNEPTDQGSISPAPNALVLFNPVIDNGPGGFAYDRIGYAYKNFSPLHNIVSGAPPTIMFFGTEDHLVPVETAKYYQMVMEKVGSRCELHLYDGQGHGFFNKNRNFEHYEKTVNATDVFLQSLGYLSQNPVIKIE
ncbi:alpha/beta hydrolase [Aestuariivivens sediminis]|uniref:alpha/beta hydrolase n=1 Tax=Aestuariivivens sediminis TaxID=2913557 RepID=UPI001F583B10|nr:alpha/beta hydrolase [Aestuariivivens sediminis]